MVQACDKFSLDPDAYDVVHKGKSLDLSLSWRFANLPNNCQLDLKQRSGPREDAPVTIAVQPEKGQRVQGMFMSSESLFDIISNTIGIPPSKKGQDVVCIYLQKEVIGVEQLKSTTLKSLGLTSGSGVLRIIVRDAGALQGQAHVEHLKLNKPSSSSNLPSKTQEVVADVKQNVSKFGKSLKKMVSGVFESATTSSDVPESKPETKPVRVEPKMENKGTESQKKQSASSVTFPGQMSGVTNESTEINWLDTRDALVFLMEDMKRMRSFQSEDPDDDFFKHTQEDILLMYNDLKQTVKELADRPLETRELREKRLTATAYTKTVLRICFPTDGLVIQATFLPDETVEKVEQFVYSYLEDPLVEFYLYTTPPKQVLLPQDSLVKKKLVPAANVHFGMHSAAKPVLKPELRERITSFQAIVNATKKLRDQIASAKREVEIPVPEAVSQQLESTAVSERRPNSDSAQEQKVPKWFKK